MTKKRVTRVALLAGVAALSIASAAHAADATLPKAMIGQWCPTVSGAMVSKDDYVRRIGEPVEGIEPRSGVCHAVDVLQVGRSGYDGHEWDCTFNEVKRRAEPRSWAPRPCATIVSQQLRCRLPDARAQSQVQRRACQRPEACRLSTLRTPGWPSDCGAIVART